jgi:cytochrome c-type biogenesis protein CcsB
MRNTLKFLLSIKFGGLLLLLIAFSAATATFIENDFGAIAAKAAVYNAWWFELLILLTFINIAWNAIKIRPLKTKKYLVFTFHIAFLFIILGAAVTRYIGFEGSMHIREGQSANTILSDETYLRIQTEENGQSFSAEEKVLFTPVSNPKENFKLKTKQKAYSIKTIDFIPNAQEYVVEAAQGPETLSLSGTIDGRFIHFTLAKGETKVLGKNKISFEVKNDAENCFRINKSAEGLTIQMPDNGNLISMMSSQSTALRKDSVYTFEKRKVYQIGTQSVVLREHFKHAQMSVEQNPDKKANGLNAVKVIVSNEDGKQIETYALGRKTYLSPAHKFQFDGKTFAISYGSKNIELPFSLKLIDFQLERYPASNSPSSYASEVVLIDKRINLKKNFRIFMNNVLDYDSYRFFQSSYDPDEKGTILSVNHDWWGMMITYVGYALMMLAMLLAIFERPSRFQFLIRHKTVKFFILALFMTAGMSLLSPASAQAQNSLQNLEKIPAQHLEKLNRLIVQGHSNRFKPLNSVCDETFRKYSRLSKYKGLTPEKVMLGMMLDPNYWMRQELIKVSNKQLKNIIGNQGSRAAFNDFFDRTKQPAYKLGKYVDEAYRKNPGKRSTFEKDLITVDERVNVFYMSATGRFLNIFPVPNHPEIAWKNTLDDFSHFPAKDSAFAKTIFSYYINALQKGMQTNKWEDAGFYLDAIFTYQKRYASAEILENTHFDLEILYNKLDIFNRLSMVDGLFGFILLLLLFIKILSPKYEFKWGIRLLFMVLFLGFIVHSGGLVLRWYISGHAPWSNGYESMIFIGWATMLAGLSFYRKSPIALGATALLTFLILFVAHLSWMNPEITNLVPVLKSYWLTIHVAVITASYGFLALGLILGIINLILMGLQTKKNKDRVQLKIKELSRVNEATLISGLYLLTIGTFLGGIWANESWGRYWGWDPKETWAFVTILIYAFVVHMRMIPGLKSIYTFNVASIFSYFSILMTFFGVNYYLSGLHSYAQGDPMPIPNFVYYTVGFLVSLSVFAYFANKKHPIK